MEASWCLQILKGAKLENTDVKPAMNVAMLQSLQALMCNVSSSCFLFFLFVFLLLNEQNIRFNFSVVNFRLECLCPGLNLGLRYEFRL